MAESTGEIGAAEEAIREAAGRVTDDMRTASEQVMEAQKQRLADLAQRLANALRRSADAFAEEGGGLIARSADRAADAAEQLSNRLRRQSWRASLAEVEAAARRQPELFFAGAVAAGFVFGRLITHPAQPGTRER